MTGCRKQGFRHPLQPKLNLRTTLARRGGFSLLGTSIHPHLPPILVNHTYPKSENPPLPTSISTFFAQPDLTSNRIRDIHSPILTCTFGKSQNPSNLPAFWPVPPKQHCLPAVLVKHDLKPTGQNAILSPVVGTAFPTCLPAFLVNLKPVPRVGGNTKRQHYQRAAAKPRKIFFAFDTFLSILKPTSRKAESPIPSPPIRGKEGWGRTAFQHFWYRSPEAEAQNPPSHAYG